MQWTRAVSWTAAIVLSLLFVGELALLVISSFPGLAPLPGVIYSEFGPYYDSDRFVRFGQTSLVSSVSILLGVVGCGLMVDSISRRSLAIPSPLTLGALCSVCLTWFLLVGLDLSFANFDGILPRIEVRWLEVIAKGPHSPTLSDCALLLEVLDQSATNLLVAMLLFGLAAGTFRFPAVAAVVLATAIGGFPFVVAWIYGRANLFDLIPTDTNMAFPVHVLAGSAGFAVILGGRFLPAHSPRQTFAADDLAVARLSCWHLLTRRQLTVFGIGFVSFLIFIARPSRLLAPAARELAPDPLADLTLLATIAGGTSALLASLILRRRSTVHYFAVGCLAGWAIVAGAGNEIGLAACLALGAVAGLLATAILNTLDRHRFDDPFGIIPAQLVCGSLGALAAGFLPLSHLPSASWSDLFDQAGAVLATSLFGFTIGGVVALVAWLTGTLWEPVARLSRS